MARRIGRPLASDATDTEDRILRSARDHFGRLGYRATTLKVIAAAADVTPGAIYHHYDSKQALFRAVYDDVAERVFAEFASVMERELSFADTLCGIFDVAANLHDADPTLAQFAAVSATEVRRHPELAASIPGSDVTPTLFVELAARGAASGDLPVEVSPEALGHMLVAVTIGLAHFAAFIDSRSAYRQAVGAVEHFVRAGLVARPGDHPSISAR